MSKITKENVVNAIKSIREKVSFINSGTYREWQTIDNYIEQQEKQDKLLELYKELNKLHKELLGPTRKLWPQIKDIENEIKELEK